MRKHLLFVLTLCLSFFFLMCETEQEESGKMNQTQSVIQEKGFVDDNYLENWVESNLEVLETYNRDEIATYSRTVQKAIMRSLSPIKRKKIWQSKMDYLLSSSDLSKEEKKYLQWFADKLEHLSYEKAFDKDSSQEMYDKVIKGIDKFGWSKTQAYKMFFSVGDISNNDNQQEAMRKAVTVISIIDVPGGNGTWCECYYDLGCPNWDCDSDANCDDDDSPHDCGVFGGTDCDGNC